MRRILALVPRGAGWRMTAILIVAAVIRLAFFTGYHGFDDVYYIRRAYALSQGVFTPPDTHWAARIGLVGPTAIGYRLFGVALWSTVLTPFCCSLLSVVVAALLGRRLYGEKVGWLAPLLLAIFPMDAIFASMLFPTAPVTLLCGLGYGLFLLGDAEDIPLAHFAAGAAFGLACVVHEAAVIALMFYPLYVIVHGRTRRGHFLALAGFATGLAIDPVIHGLMGNVRARLDVISRSATAEGTAEDVAYRGFNVHWIAEPIVRLLAERTFGLFSWLIAPLALYRAFRPARPHDRALSLILISVFLWTEYGTLSLHRYAPLARLPRYLCPLTLPAIWLLAKNLCDITQARRRRILLGLLAGSSLVCLLLDMGNQLLPYESIRSALATVHPYTVAVEQSDEFPLRFAERMNPTYTLSALGTALPEEGVVIISSRHSRRDLLERPTTGRIATVSRQRTPYQWLLSSRFALAILRVVRPPSRFAEYEDKALTETWTIYRPLSIGTDRVPEVSAGPLTATTAPSSNL